MDGLSRENNKRIINSSTLYDFIVFAYVVAMFVLENERFGIVFSVIQAMFFIYSLFMLGKVLRVSFCLKWCVCVILFSLVLMLVNFSESATVNIVIVIKNMLKCFLFFIYMKDEDRIEKVLKYIGVSGIVCGVVLTIEFLKSGMSYDNLLYATISRIGADIAGGNVNIVGMDMCIAFVSWLYLTGKQNNKSLKTIAFIFLGFVLLSSLLTGSRKIIAFYVVTFAIANIQSSKRNIVLVICGFVFLYIAMMEIEPLYFLIGHKFDFFSGNTAYKMYQDTNQDRVSMIGIGLQTFLENPWGIGLGNTREIVGSYTHNNYVEILVSLGVVGFLVYYFPYFYTIKYCIKNKSNALARFVIYSLIGFMLLEFWQVTYLYSVPMVFLAVVMSIVDVHRSNRFSSKALMNNEE